MSTTSKLRPSIQHPRRLHDGEYFPAGAIESASRRRVLSLALASALALMSCASGPARAEPMVVDTTGVKDVGDLTRAIKEAGRGLLPKTTSDDPFLAAMAKSFVDNARDAADRHGVQIPSWILDHLPDRSATWSRPDKTDAMVFITILGIVFILPKLIFFSVVLASMLLMTKYIADEIRKLSAKATRGG